VGGRASCRTALVPGALDFSNPRILDSDVARSWKFYRDVPGLTPNMGHGEPRYGQFVLGGRALLGVFEQGRRDDTAGPAPAPDPSLVVGRTVRVLEMPYVDAVAQELER
jgi:hypothetical protein